MAAAKDQLLDAIRSLMAAHSPPLHALVVPSEDAHQVRPYLTLPPPPPPSRGGGGAISGRGRLVWAGLWFCWVRSACPVD